MQYFLFFVVVLVLLVILWNRHTKIQLKTQNQRMEQQKNMQYRYFSERIAQNCKNRHPSPICTQFEHHFHALKPHLLCHSF